MASHTASRLSSRVLVCHIVRSISKQKKKGTGTTPRSLLLLVSRRSCTRGLGTEQVWAAKAAGAPAPAETASATSATSHTPPKKTCWSAAIIWVQNQTSRLVRVCKTLWMLRAVFWTLSGSSADVYDSSGEMSLFETFSSPAARIVEPGGAGSVLHPRAGPPTAWWTAWRRRRRRPARPRPPPGRTSNRGRRNFRCLKRHTRI